jgi:hypothetical protein
MLVMKNFLYARDEPYRARSCVAQLLNSLMTDGKCLGIHSLCTCQDTYITAGSWQQGMTLRQHSHLMNAAEQAWGEDQWVDGDANFMKEGTFRPLVEWLSKDLAVRLSWPVESIEWSKGRGAKVHGPHRQVHLQQCPHSPWFPLFSC